MADSDFTTEELNAEEWRPVPGYEGFYEASNLGRVKRVAPRLVSRPSDILGASRKSYGVVLLSRNGKVKGFRKCRLIAQVFLGPCPEGMQVNHIDGDKTNDRVTNLEYVTPQGNSVHAVRTGLRKLAVKLTPDQVREIRRVYRAKEADGPTLAARYGVGKTIIYSIVKGKKWRHLL